MVPSVRQAFDAEMARAREGATQGDRASAWRALERAHILSQPFAWPHVRVHAAMLGFALRSGDWREIAGQLPRLVLAAPASLLGRAPRGNTGGANVGILTPLPMPPDLEAILERGRRPVSD